MGSGDGGTRDGDCIHFCEANKIYCVCASLRYIVPVRYGSAPDRLVFFYMYLVHGVARALTTAASLLRPPSGSATVRLKVFSLA